MLERVGAGAQRLERDLGGAAQRGLDRPRARRFLLIASTFGKRYAAITASNDGGIGVGEPGERTVIGSIAARAFASAAFSSSVLFLDFASPATITSSDVPIAPAIAAAVPPPGVGSGLASAASSCDTVMSAKSCVTTSILV